MPVRHLSVYAIPLLGLAVLISVSSGCVSLAANLMYAIKGNERPAEYEGLEKQTVAVVCSNDGGLEADATSMILTQVVQANLATNVEEINLVPQDEVERWLNSHGWSDSDYVEIGKGVKADKVLAIDVAKLSLKDGSTLYRGQCDLSVTVYDIKDGGKVVYRKQIPEFVFPTMGGPTITDTSESKFRKLYVTIIAQKVSGLFYPVDATAEVALDAKANSF